MKFQEAIRILSHNQAGDYYKAAVKVAKSVAIQRLIEWAYNRRYDGFETVDILEIELGEEERK